MLLGGKTQDHASDAIVIFGEGYVLEGVVMVRVRERGGDNLGKPGAEHKAEKAFGGLVKVAATGQAFMVGRLGGSDGYRILIHGVI